jgi:hypothetical protein
VDEIQSARPSLKNSEEKQMRIEVENEQVSGKKRPLELTVVNTSREMSNNVSTNATANLPIKVSILTLS